MLPERSPSSLAQRSLCLRLISALVLCGCTTSPEGPASLLFEGDSDIEYWDTSGYAGAANVGVGGATCRDVLDTIEDVLAEYQPSEVVLVCGENDLWEQGVRATFEDFSGVVSRIQARGATVYYMGTKPEPSTTSLHAEYQEYDALIRTHAESLSAAGAAPLVMIDVYPVFETADNPDSPYLDDGLHLSGAGYALWDAWLAAARGEAGCILWERASCVVTAAD